jgi:hypothetical protein
LVGFDEEDRVGSEEVVEGCEEYVHQNRLKNNKTHFNLLGSVKK